MRMMIAILVVLTLATPAAAEPTPLKWPSHRTVAGHLSDGLVAAALAADTVSSWRSHNRRRAFSCQVLRLGFTLGVAELTKRLVHRDRPDGSDAKSFFSGHTAAAMASAGWRVDVGIPIAVGAGYLRMAANKHYATDVLAGAAVGYFAHNLCEP